MSQVHFKTVQEFPLVPTDRLPLLKSQSYYPPQQEPDFCNQVFNLLSRFIEQPDIVYTLGFKEAKPNGEGPHDIPRFTDQLQVEHNSPILKLRHRTSIEDAILQHESEKSRVSGDVDHTVSSGWASCLNFEGSCFSFEATQYLNYEQLVLLFSNREPELMVQCIGLLCKYLYLKGEQLTRHNVLRLLAASAMISFKINYDNHPGMLQYLSQVFELPTPVLVGLERAFCEAVGFDMSLEGKVQAWIRRNLMF